MVSVGSFNVKLTVKYQSIMGMPVHGDTTIIQAISVVHPNTDVVVAGLNTPTALDQTGTIRVDVDFEMRDGSTAIGPHFDGYAQEYLLSWEGYNPDIGNWVDIQYNPIWSPPSGQTSPFFYRAGKTIIDKKHAYCDPAWYATFALNFAWMRVTQKNRLVTTNWLFEEVIIEFPSHNFTMQKSGASTWILVE